MRLQYIIFTADKLSRNHFDLFYFMVTTLVRADFGEGDATSKHFSVKKGVLSEKVGGNSE